MPKKTLPFAPRPSAIARAAACLLALHLHGAHAQPVAFDIPAQPLASALGQFARQAGLQLVFAPGLAQDRRAPALVGAREVQPALDTLLQGSGLVGRVDGGTLTVGAVSSAQRSLSEVTVTANQLGEITEGTGSYTPGAIATATRLVLTPRETPQSISVVTRQVMDDFNLTSIDQVMEHTPGVSIVTYDSERTEYYARGFAIQNFQYDGIPMSRDSAFSAGNTLSDTAIYDRVEVLKGATGLLTGTGDPGATINLIRKKPTRTFQGHASASAGSWDTYRGEIDVGGTVNAAGTLRARAVASYQDKHSQLDHYRRKTSVLYGVLEADLGPRTLLTVGGDYQDNKPMGSTWGGIPLYNADGNFNAMPRSFNNGASWSRWEQYTRTGFATLEHTFDSGWVGKLQFNHQINGYDANLGGAAAGYPNPVDGSGASLWVGQYIGRTTSNAIDAYASGPFSLGGREHELVLGGSVANRRWKNDGYWNLPGYDYDVPNYYQWTGNAPAPQWGAPDGRNDETTRERGLYATARWNLRDDLKLITGARVLSYTAPDIRESSVLVPYLGAVYDLNDTWSAYASYTTIFKPQAAQDASGRRLDPLEGENREIGLKAAFFGGRLNASAAYFDLVQDNYAEATGERTPTGDTAYRALQGVRTKGFEIEASGSITPAWQLQAGLSHSVARQQGERVSTLTPASQITLYTSYKPAAVAGLTLGGGVRWLDKTWGDASNPVTGTARHTVGGYWLADASARYEFDRHLSASVAVNNLFDKRYYTIFSWYSTYTWGAPRSVNVSLNYKF